MEAYEKLTGERESIVALLAMPEVAVIEFEAEKLWQISKPVEFD